MKNLWKTWRASEKRRQLYIIIFQSDTRAGKNFDIALLITILLSVLLVLIETIPAVHREYAKEFYIAEWVITVVFTLEYILRLMIAPNPFKYTKSFYGIVDLMAILPTYLSIFILGSQSLMTLRTLRLLRVFRILRLVHFMKEGNQLTKALYDTRFKIGVFFFGIICLVVVIGTIMYLIEGPEGGFNSIPLSIYWAVVTMTTVGYGDIIPHSDLGRLMATFVMLLGYSIIAVPTGIVGAELSREIKRKKDVVCPKCAADKHDLDAYYCKRCGQSLP